jgi:UDP-glucuronate 4-epimerase
VSEERFLVTGSEGCIGSWVVKRLVEQGHACVAVDLETQARRLRRIAGPEVVGSVAFEAGDLTDPELLPPLLTRHRIGRVIHLAALQIPFVAADPLRGALVNVVGTLRVLEAVRQASTPTGPVVYASSAAVFDAAGALRPTTLYGAFQLCTEHCARIYGSGLGLATVGLRPAVVFGPGRDQGLTAAPTHAAKAAVLGVPYRIPFAGRVNLQYADDVAAAFIQAALATPSEPLVLDLAGAVVEIGEVVAAIERACPQARGLIEYGGEPIPIPAEADDSELRRALGDVPATPLDAAVRLTVDHFVGLREAGVLRADELPAANGPGRADAAAGRP